MARITQQSSIHTTGTSYENEPIIKSDGAGNVMQWLSNNESSNITISEDGSNNLDLVVSAGNVGVGGAPASEAGGTTVHIAETGGTNSAVLNLTGGSGGDGSFTGQIQFNDKDDTDERLAMIGGSQSGVGTPPGGKLHFYTQANAGALTERLTISSAGTVTVGGVFSLPVAVAHISSDGLQRLYYNSSAETIHNSGASTGLLHSFRNTGGTTVADISSTGLTVTGGIVETNGVLKKNLLSNSSFGVWSNSTLEDVGSDLMGAMTDNASYPWETRPAGGLDGAWANTTGWGVAYKAVSLTAGKLYQIKFDGSSITGGAASIGTASNTSGTNWVNRVEITAASNITSVFEASATTTYIFMQTNAEHAAGFTLANFTLYEVTPGCVAADTLAFDGWYKDSTLDIWRQHNDGGTLTHDGSFYALKVTTSNTNRSLIWQNALSSKAEFYQRFAGRTVTLGAWVKTSTASHAFLRLEDSTGSTDSTTHTGGGAWEWLEVTRPIAAATTLFQAHLRHALTTTDSYWSQPTLVFGSAIGEGNYSRPSGEIVWFEKAVDSNKYEGLASQGSVVAATLNLEADSNGAIPKGAKAVMIYSFIKDSVSSTGNAFLRARANSTTGDFYVNDASGKGNDVQSRFGGSQPCDSNGDIQVQLEATGGTTLDIDGFEYKGVQLR